MLHDEAMIVESINIKKAELKTLQADLKAVRVRKAIADKAEKDEFYQVFVRTPKATTITLQVKPSDTLASLKRQVHRIEGVKVELQRLAFNNVEFDASSSRKSLKTLRVLSGCTLTLSVRGTGGGKRGKVET